MFSLHLVAGSAFLPAQRPPCPASCASVWAEFGKDASLWSNLHQGALCWGLGHSSSIYTGWSHPQGQRPDNLAQEHGAFLKATDLGAGQLSFLELTGHRTPRIRVLLLTGASELFSCRQIRQSQGLPTALSRSLNTSEPWHLQDCSQLRATALRTSRSACRLSWLSHGRSAAWSCTENKHPRTHACMRMRHFTVSPKFLKFILCVWMSCTHVSTVCVCVHTACVFSARRGQKVALCPWG